VVSDGNYYAPDAIIVNEISSTQLATLRDELNTAFSVTTPTPTASPTPTAIATPTASPTPSPSPSPSIAASVSHTEATSSFLYEIVGDADVPKAKLLVNVGTIDLSNSSTRSWADGCKSDRLYQLASGLVEKQSGSKFTLAGVHLLKRLPSFSASGRLQGTKRRPSPCRACPRDKPDRRRGGLQQASDERRRRVRSQ
jgi:hypothetical protein